VAFFAEVVELVPNQRRTLKLYLPSGVLLGFATWRVQESGGRTRVEYDVYSEFLRPPFTSVAARDSARRADLDFARANQRRFDQELVALKRLVESDRSR
jgi:hypothetical protein